MKTPGRQLAGTISAYAHLVAPTRAAAKRSASETDDERNEREEEERKANKAATGHAETDDEREKREDDEEAAARAEEGDDDDDDSGKGKRAEGDDDGDERPDEDEEDDDEEMKKAKSAKFGKGLRAARRLERRRISRILSSPAAAGRVASAAHLACHTGLSSRQAIALLDTMAKEGAAAPRKSALSEAMERNRPALGPGGSTAAVNPLAAAMAGEVKKLEARRGRR